MSNPVNILGKYGIGPWGKAWGAIWYINQNNWNWWNWWNRWTIYQFSNNAYWIWNVPNAQNNAPVNEPIVFKYTYNNTTGNDINALLYYICDDVGKFYVNDTEIIETMNYGRQRLPFVLKTGINKIEAVCVNLGGPAGLIVDVKNINNGQILFSTNGDWTYDTNYTNKIINDSYCSSNKNATNGYINVDNVGFGIDIKDDDKSFEKGEYLLLSRQTLNGTFFDKKVSMSHKLNDTDPSNANYMDGTLLNNSFKIDGKFIFKLVWPGTGLSMQIWKQSSDPFKTKTVQGYENINAPFWQNYWGGLKFDGRYCVLSGSTNEWWYYAVGSFAQWQGGIPGPVNPVQSVELYVLKPKVGNYTNLGYNDIPWNDISYDNNIAFNKCAERCDQIDGCNAFTQNVPNGQGCWFKSKAANKYANSSRLSFARDLANPNMDVLINPKDISGSDNYTLYKGYDSSPYDIPGAAFGNATVEKCKTYCNNKPDCAGFAFAYNTCYPKYSTMYPNGVRQKNERVDLYTKNNNGKYKPIGGYRDTSNRAIPTDFGTGYNADTCSQKTKDNGFKYFGLQYPQGGTQCFGGNDLNQAKKYGPVNTTMQGGPWANYVYENVNNSGANSDSSEKGCITKCNNTSECVGYSFDKSKLTNNCNMFKKLPKYFHKNSSKKIAFKPGNISDFNNLSQNEQNNIKKQCGTNFLSKKFNISEDVINKCISLKNNGAQTSGFNVDPACLFTNLPQDSPLKKNNTTNSGLENKSLSASVRNDVIDSNIKDFYKYIDKEVAFANLNNKEILKEPSNSPEYIQEIKTVHNAGGLSYLENTKELNNEIINKLGTKNIEKFSNLESKYADNLKYNQQKWYFIGLFIILLIILLYYFKLKL